MSDKNWTDLFPPGETEDPAFPTDAGVERPDPPGWHPCWHVPDGVTCPLCDAPVIPCYNLNPAGPPCARARWKPGATSRGALCAHVECVEAHESNDAVARLYRELEECAGLETRAWEQARMATELRIRSEQAYRDAMKGSGK